MFTIIEGDFTSGQYSVQNTLILLEDWTDRERNYYLDKDITRVKIEASSEKETTFIVTFKDGKSFTAKADTPSFKNFMEIVGQPVKSTKKSAGIFLIPIVVIAILLKFCTGGEKGSGEIALPDTQPNMGQPLLSPEVEYFAILESEILNMDSTDVVTAVQDGPGVLAGIDRVKTWAKLYEEHKKYAVTDPQKLELIRTFKTKVSAHQKKLFPRLREVHGKVMKENAWEHDIDVSVYGKGARMLRFTGAEFVRNANIKVFMDATYGSIEPLRYKRIAFRWDKQYGTETFYDLTPPDDGDLKP